MDSFLEFVYCLHTSWLATLQDALAAGDGEEPDAAFEDAEYFRRLNNTRKSRAEKFLKHALSRFYLLSTSTVAMVIAPITRLLFAMHEVKDDEKVLRQDSKQAKRVRMRQRCKGADAFAEDDRPVQYCLADLLKASNRAVDQLWEGSVFDVACAFWPPHLSKWQMYETLVEERLSNISQIKWRIAGKFILPPFNAAWLDRFTSLDEVPADRLQQAVNAFCKMDECCLDPFWSMPAQKRVQAADDKLACFFDLVKEFFRNFRPTSLNEEKKHSTQRKFAGGHSAMPRSFAQQASMSVLKELADLFEARGGRDLQSAPDEVLEAAQKARVKKTVWKRPAQKGSAMFFYISKQREMGCADRSFAALANQWKNMSVESKQTWKNLHRCQLARDRSVRDLRFPKDLKRIKTLWGVGDDTWPLRLEFLDQWMESFRTRSNGLRALKEISEQGHFKFQQKCAEYCQAVENGKIRYHSNSAAELAGKAKTAVEITQENEGHIYTAQEIMQTGCPPHHCQSKHPGCCQAKHHAQISMIKRMIKVLPKEPCVLRCEMVTGRNKKLLYVRLTIGQTACDKLQVWPTWLSRVSII